MGMTKKMLNKIENDYWKGKADAIDMTEVFDLASRGLERKPCKDYISRADAKEIIAQTDITDGYELVFSGRQVIALLDDLPSVQPKSKTEHCDSERDQIIKELIDLYDVLEGGFEESEDSCETFPVARSEYIALGKAIKILKGEQE